MRATSPDPRRRAERLLRWYPAPWRARYGSEFCELLVAEIVEQPRCLHRSLDVAVGGITARWADAGLAGSTTNSSDQGGRSLATFGCALAAYLTFAVSIWSQLNIARRWSEPSTPATHTAIVIMTIGLLGCIALAAIGAAPIGWHAVVAVARRRTPGLGRPAVLFSMGTAVLIAGGLYFRNGWSGSGSLPWAHQATGPGGGVVAFMWASTLAVSAYWAHPGILLSFPPGEIIWMVISPLALLSTVVGAAQTVRRLDLPVRLVRFASHLARLTSLMLGVFLFGTLVWLVDGGPGPNSLFQAGTVVVIGLVVMTTAMGLAVRSAHRAADSPSRAGA